MDMDGVLSGNAMCAFMTAEGGTKADAETSSDGALLWPPYANARYQRKRWFCIDAGDAHDDKREQITRGGGDGERPYHRRHLPLARRYHAEPQVFTELLGAICLGGSFLWNIFGIPPDGNGFPKPIV